MRFLLTCQAGLEKIAKNEVIKQAGVISCVKDRLVFFEGEENMIAKINLHSRVGNKLYLILNSNKNIDTFDSLFDLVHLVDWEKYIIKNSPITVKATSIKSKLMSNKTIQKITKKAIVKNLNNNTDQYLLEDIDLPSYEVFMFLFEDEAFILLNTSGETLYKRGYKINTGEAPIKESLAAGMIILSNWDFNKTFYDPFCGSGTIAIEAILLAKNIAPGLKRNFAFENWSFIDKKTLSQERKKALKNIFPKKYNIIATDISKELIDIAKENAKNAGVLDDITFEVKDFKEYKNENLSGTLITNPPYGIRLKDYDLKEIYKDLVGIFETQKDLKGGFISSYTDFNHKSFKNRKLYNGNQISYFYFK